MPFKNREDYNRYMRKYRVASSLFSAFMQKVEANSKWKTLPETKKEELTARIKQIAKDFASRYIALEDEVNQILKQKVSEQFDLVKMRLEKEFGCFIQNSTLNYKEFKICLQSQRRTS